MSASLSSRRPSSRTVLAAFALVALAGTLFAAGTRPAVAPEAACVPEVTVAATSSSEAEASAPLDASQRALSAYFARRYMVAAQATSRWVGAAYDAAEEVGLDPLLVLAVISVESRFNPVAESAMGAKGLMQIIPRFHRDKLEDLGGEEAVLDPETNIRVGARILQEYVYRTGTLEAGLQSYNGATSDESAQYAQRILAERSRLDEVLRAALKSQHALERSNTTTGS